MHYDVYGECTLYRSWYYCCWPPGGIQGLFLVTFTPLNLKKTSFPIILQGNGEHRLHAHACHEQRMSLSMESLWKQSTATLACFIVHPVVPTAPYATIAFYDLIIIALGLGNASARYAPLCFCTYTTLVCARWFKNHFYRTVYAWWVLRASCGGKILRWLRFGSISRKRRFWPWCCKSSWCLLRVFLVMGCTVLYAEKLSILFHVRVFDFVTMCICLCNVCNVHKNPGGWRRSHSLESSFQVASFHCPHGVYFHLCMVRGWTYRVPSVPHWYKPGVYFLDPAPML